jgi:hypothetical protein
MEREREVGEVGGSSPLKWGQTLWASGSEEREGERATSDVGARTK